MPLGFKLPFNPEDFLSRKAIETNASPESRKFIESVIKVAEDLKEQGIEDSIVLGFDIFLESVKKSSNSDLLVAITAKNEADATFSKRTAIRLSNDPNVQAYTMTDEQFREIFPHTYKDVVEWGKNNINDFTKGKIFNDIMRDIKKDIHCTAERRLDSKNPNSSSQNFYSDEALPKIKASL